MNQNTLKNIIISLLVIIIILLVLLYLYHSRATPIPSSTNTISKSSNSSNPTIVKSVPPVILDSPYVYDSGYLVSPDEWWMGTDAGDTYVHNNYKTNYNYYYDKATNSNKPIPTTTTASATTSATLSQGMLPPQPNPTPSTTISGIQEILPTGQLISPSQDSIFPLPTLAAPCSIIPPNVGQMPTLSLSAMQQQIPIPSMISNSMAAKVDILASQLLGMRGGNTNLEPSIPEMQPNISQAH